jgi:hypothetical protein
VVSQLAPVADGRGLRRARLVWAGINAVALTICLVAGVYTLVAQRPMPGFGAFAGPALGLFVIGALAHGLSRLPRLRGRIPASEPMSIGGGRLLRALLAAFALMVVSGFVIGPGRPAAPQPGCPYPMGHRFGPYTCATAAQYHAAQAAGERTWAAILGTGFTAFAAPVLSPLVGVVAPVLGVAVAPIRRRRRATELESPSRDGAPSGDVGPTGTAAPKWNNESVGKVDSDDLFDKGDSAPVNPGEGPANPGEGPSETGDDLRESRSSLSEPPADSPVPQERPAIKGKSW